jgi:hypothetical protein
MTFVYTKKSRHIDKVLEDAMSGSPRCAVDSGRSGAVIWALGKDLWVFFAAGTVQGQEPWIFPRGDRSSVCSMLPKRAPFMAK